MRVLCVERCQDDAKRHGLDCLSGIVPQSAPSLRGKLLPSSRQRRPLRYPRRTRQVV
jgi:hypothetical protein